jgi:hypothetical protein
VFVTSRPETTIRNMFGQAHIYASMARLALHHDIEEEVIRHDIRLYLRHELDELACNHRIPLPFPSGSVFSILVQRADTLLIYVRAVTAYIASPIGEPLEQLAELLDSSATSSPEQYTHLGALYHQILTKAHDTFGRSTTASQQFRAVLACLVLLKQSVNVSALASFANIAEPLCKNIIRSLSSIPLYDLESVAEPVRLMHPSLANCLTDQDRCNDSNYHVGSDVKSRLAVAIMRCYINTEDTHLLDEVVNLNSTAPRLAVRSDADKEHTTSCMSLADALRNRYDEIGHLRILEEAVRLGREAVGLCSSSYFHRAESCVNLGKSLRTQYRQSGEAAPPQEAVTLEREALSLCSTGHSKRAVSCASLASSLWTQYQQSGKATLLEETITLEREALRLRLIGHPKRVVSCTNIAISLRQQYNITAKTELLPEALTLEQEAATLKTQCTSYAKTLLSLSEQITQNRNMDLRSVCVRNSSGILIGN